MEQIKLTTLTECGGCAAKMPPQTLANILAELKPYTNPNLLVGLGMKDDAAILRINADTALVQTTDFFPPLVDDPYIYGGIAAAHAMSDVYAMGGEVISGMNLVSFPADLPHTILSSILQGGMDKMAEVGAMIVGGHTLIDKEPKYGLSVTGLIHPDKVLTKGGAQVGDYLYLTKPLGTGIIISGYKHTAVYRADYHAAIESMLKLNRNAAQILQSFGNKIIHACTDITGFGLLGHASEMAEASKVVDLVIDSAALPLLPRIFQYANEGWLPGGVERNYTYLMNETLPKVQFIAPVSQELQDIAFDPETSGGLFFSVSADQALKLETAFAQAGEFLRQVGFVRGGNNLVLVK